MQVIFEWRELGLGQYDFFGICHICLNLVTCIFESIFLSAWLFDLSSVCWSFSSFSSIKSCNQIVNVALNVVVSLKIKSAKG